MKKLLIMIICGVGTVGSAAAIDCSNPPTCDELGYTMSASQCSGFRSLKCPFDASKVYCSERQPVSYKAGAILYSDGNFYADTPLNPSLKPVGIAITNEECIVMDLVGWHSRNVAEEGTDSSAKNYTVSNYMDASLGGYSETQALARYSDYGMVVELGELTFSNGESFSWFVPNAVTVEEIYNNRNAIQSAWQQLKGTSLSFSYRIASSTEVDADNIIAINMGKGGVAEVWTKDDDGIDAYTPAVAYCE